MTLNQMRKLRAKEIKSEDRDPDADKVRDLLVEIRSAFLDTPFGDSTKERWILGLNSAVEFLGTCKALSADQRAEFEDKIEDLESDVESLTNAKEDAEFERDEAERQVKELDAVIKDLELKLKGLS